MKAIRVHDYSQTPKIEDVLVPQISPDQVLVRVQAAALNPLDAHLVSGFAKAFFPLRFPFTLGTDVAGVIARVGEAVTGWRVGDAVIAQSDPLESGGCAEYVTVTAPAIVALPEQLTFQQGAGIPTAGGTAWHALFSVGGLKAGETVLVHAASGGVGTFAVQFAHRAGARIIATASEDSLARVRNLGADEVIDYRTQDFTQRVSGVDMVLDLVGGETQARSFDVLRAGGRLVSTVQPPDKAFAQEKGIAASMFLLTAHASRLDIVVDAVVTQGVEVVTDLVVPLSRFPLAWTRQQSQKARGKIILTDF